MKDMYFDYAATTPCDARVVKAMLPFFSGTFANANSPHRMGQASRKALEDARASLARDLHAQTQEIIVTSGGTEANNHAIRAMAAKHAPGKVHIVASSIEHHSVIEPLKDLAAAGHITITWVNPDSQGIIHTEEVAKALRPETTMVIVHHANNQIGTIQPIEDISALCKKHQVALMVDAVQTVGHIPVDVLTLGADIVSFSAHKFYGPKGVGALMVRKHLDLGPLILGGDQERGRRAGTVNVPGAVGMACALSLALETMASDQVREEKLRERIIAYLTQNIPQVTLNGHRSQRLANNVNVSFEGISSEQLITALDLAGLAVSMGSACTAGKLAPSHVLKALGRSDAMALGALRITVGRFTTDEDVDVLLKAMEEKVALLRRIA